MSKPDVDGVTGQVPAGAAVWLVRLAARQAPAELAGRLEEEWLADLLQRRTALSRLRLAAGCWWATGIIAREHLAAGIATAAAAQPMPAGRSVVFGGDEGAGLSPRRSLTLVVVVGLHVALFYALISGAGVTLIREIVPEWVDLIPDVPRPVEKVSPSSGPPIESRFRIPEPTVTEVLPPVEPAVVGDALPAGPPPVEAGQPVTPVVRISGGPGQDFPAVDDYYPRVSRTLGEEGVGTVHVCVDATGRLSGLPSLDQATGSPRLDAAALALAKAGSGHYRPATEDGRPVGSCYAFRVRFQLRR